MADLDLTIYNPNWRDNPDPLGQTDANGDPAVANVMNLSLVLLRLLIVEGEATPIASSWQTLMKDGLPNDRPCYCPTV